MQTGRLRRRPIELLFNLDHPEELSVVTDVNEDGYDEEDDGEELIDDEAEPRISSACRGSLVIGVAR